MAYRKSEKLKDNISAIRTAFEIERSGREATEKEKATLRKYSGFGGLKFILNPCGEEDDVAKWSRSDRPLFNATRELYALLKENARDVAEYKRFVTSIRNSILSAFYTPVKVVQAIAQVFGDYRVPVTSTKSLTGHEMWMAGASEIIYSMLMMKNDFIGGSLNFENPDEVTKCINVVPETLQQHFDIFLSNSFGFGGTNSTLIIKNC